MLKQFLFGFPIIKQSIDESLYDKNKIVADILHNFDLDNNRNEWDSDPKQHGRPSSNLHHSANDENNSKFKKIDYSDLIPLYNKAVANSLNQLYFKDKVNFTYYIDNYTCLKNSSYMREHVHLDSDFTAIHYLRFNNKQHFPTNFVNTQKHSNYNIKLIPTLVEKLDTSAVENSWMCDNYSINTDENDFVLTPAIVEHSIPYHNNCDDHRITIVLNIKIE